MVWWFGDPVVRWSSGSVAGIGGPWSGDPVVRWLGSVVRGPVTLWSGGWDRWSVVR